MSNKDTPFFTQAAVLDELTHSPHPEADPAIIDIVLEMLEEKKELRRYFFQSRPHPDWAPVLWQHGLLTSPPSPQEAGDQRFYPRWDAQEYLASVASDAPDVVVDHIKALGGAGWYKSNAVRMLSSIPKTQLLEALPQVLTWLDDPEIAWAIFEPAYELMLALAKSGQSEPSFSLFESLIAPIAPQDSNPDEPPMWSRNEAVAKHQSSLADWHRHDAVSLLSGFDLGKLIEVFDHSLRTALEIEASLDPNINNQRASYWRTAIEPSEQNLNFAYKEKLLGRLRTTLDMQFQENVDMLDNLIERYLQDDLNIFRRLGLDFLHRYPDRYIKLLSRELLDFAKLDDIYIHHEFFLLLRAGFPVLKLNDQAKLIEAVLQGPPEETSKNMAVFAKETLQVDPKTYAQEYKRLWILRRLWMIKDDLDGVTSKQLDVLIAEFGEPEHPEFTSWSSGVSVVRDLSPIPEQALAELPPDQLVSLLEQWTPDPEKDEWPDRISFAGMGEAVAQVIFERLEEFRPYLLAITLLRPQYAYAVIQRFGQEATPSSNDWNTYITLCENIIADETARTQLEHWDDGSWVYARMTMVRELKGGFTNKDRRIPREHWPRVRDLFLMLLDDPDPLSEHDRPPETYAGHQDPMHVAINHIRPMALRALIVYALEQAKLKKNEAKSGDPTNETNQVRWEEVVKQAITRKLDRQQDSSWAVHSVFGEALGILNWLDKRWLEENIDSIFPENDDEETAWYFAAAWDAFVVQNRYDPSLIDLLRPKYERAIENKSKGITTRSGNFSPGGLAIHLVWEHLLSDLDVPILSSSESMLAKFVLELDPETRKNAAWACWKMCASEDFEIDKHWPKLRAFWQWRVNEATKANNETDFDAEIHQLLELLQHMPDTESLDTIWAVLEGSLPHLRTGDAYNVGWGEIETYLVQQLSKSPESVIEMYTRMYQYSHPPIWSPDTDAAREILTTSAANLTTRDTTLSLIDFIARKYGDLRFKDIYDQYAS